MRLSNLLAFAALAVMAALTLSCSKSGTSLPAKGIQAGVSDEPGLRYHDYDPDHFIAPQTLSMNGVAYLVGPGKLYIDLDNDKDNDLYIQAVDPASASGNVTVGQPFGSFYASDLTTDTGYVTIDTVAGSTLPKPTRLCYINTQRAGLSIATNLLNQNDLIDYRLSWQEISQWYPQTTILSSYTPALNGHDAIAFNDWTGNGHYVAIRDIRGRDTLYGWVGIQIENYDSVVVRDYGMMRRK